MSFTWLVTSSGDSDWIIMPGKPSSAPTVLKCVFIPSTTTQFLSWITCVTMPCFPLSLPTRTSTRSPRKKTHSATIIRCMMFCNWRKSIWLTYRFNENLLSNGARHVLLVKLSCPWSVHRKPPLLSFHSFIQVLWFSSRCFPINLLHRSFNILIWEISVFLRHFANGLVDLLKEQRRQPHDCGFVLAVENKKNCNNFLDTCDESLETSSTQLRVSWLHYLSRSAFQNCELIKVQISQNNEKEQLKHSTS